MRQGIASSLTKQIIGALARAKETGEHWWLAMDTRKVSAELTAAHDAAYRHVEANGGSREWLGSIDDRRTGLWIEVLESYRVSKGLPPY